MLGFKDWQQIPSPQACNSKTNFFLLMLGLCEFVRFPGEMHQATVMLPYQWHTLNKLQFFVNLTVTVPVVSCHCMFFVWFLCCLCLLLRRINKWMDGLIRLLSRWFLCLQIRRKLTRTKNIIIPTVVWHFLHCRGMLTYCRLIIVNILVG